MRPISALKTRFDASRAAHDAGDLRGARAALLALANDRAIADDDSLPAGASTMPWPRSRRSAMPAWPPITPGRPSPAAAGAGRGAAFQHARRAGSGGPCAGGGIAWRRTPPVALDEPVFLLGLADPGRRRDRPPGAHPGVQLITEPA